MTAPDAARLVIVPAADCLAAVVAAHIVDEQRAFLPDLSRVTLLVPTPALITPLATQLLRAAGSALLGPKILTLSAFAAERGRDTAAMSALDCRLMLAEALRRHLPLFPGQDPWTLADALFALLEELSVNAPDLAGQPDAFAERVTRAYGRRLGALSDEAQIVHVLWTAFLQQTRRRSPAVAAIDDLRVALAQLADGETSHWIGFDAFSRAETVLLREALQRGSSRLWLHGRIAGRDGGALRALVQGLGLQPPAAEASAAFNDRLFDDDGVPLPQRVGHAAPPPARLCEASGPEHEARIVDLAVRQFLLDGCADVAVVTQDRRLARRLRALLERAGVALRDEVGWALSTSRAASSLMAWLDCLEQDFHFRPLLELLKSGFLDADGASLALLERRIHRDRALQGGRVLTLIEPTLAQRLQSAAGLATARAAQAAPERLRGLIDSLAHIGLWQGWQDDAAGRQLVEELEQLLAALRRTTLALDAGELRTLLGRVLEQATFMPDPARGAVRLLTLEQARGLSCEALVLAGVTAAQWPGAPPALPVFNHAVRAELGLSHWRERHALHALRFRNLLDAAPAIVITWAGEKDGEPPQPAPWIELLLACAPALRDTYLPALASGARVEIARRSELPVALPPPRPAAAADLLPASLSASAHQALIDCPYRFHASACLGLSALDAPDEPASRKDYGERVHAILNAYAQRAPPGPVHVDDAARQLEAIAGEIFGPDLRQRFLARIWLDEFRDLVPALAGWLADRDPQFTQVTAEAQLARELAPGVKLHGRLDRLESSAAGAHRVVDYKTGKAPEAEAIIAGEQVQATHYALLAGNCVSVEFLELRRQSREPRLDRTVVDGEELTDATAAVAARLRAMSAALRHASPLAAQGDALTCSRCEFGGLCRHRAWAVETTA